MIDSEAAETPPTETDLRPHFDLFVPRPPDEVLACLEQRFHEVAWEGDLRGNHVQIMVPAKERHLWSPWLNFEVNEADGGAHIDGRFAPHPTAWTLYLALYAILGFTTLGLAFFGLSQWIAGQPPTALWAIPIGLVLMGLLYGLPFIGQGMTARQMGAMRTFVTSCLEASDQS